jgi:hypothetical protein
MDCTRKSPRRAPCTDAPTSEADQAGGRNDGLSCCEARPCRLHVPCRRQQQNTERRYWRTVLVDRKTGVLAYEIATAEKHLDKLKSRKHYTHPDGIVIDPPVQ